MFGWMCCNQWEKWDQWSEEDHRVAPGESSLADPDAPPSRLRVYLGQRKRWPATASQFAPNTTQSHLRPALAKRDGRYRLLFRQGRKGRANHGTAFLWKARIAGGRQLLVQRQVSLRSRGSPPSRATMNIFPPLESLKKFIPADKLWPINDTWYFHAGSGPGTNTLTNIQRAVEPPLRTFDQRGGFCAQGATGPLRKHPRAVRRLSPRTAGPTTK